MDQFSRREKSFFKKLNGDAHGASRNRRRLSWAVAALMAGGFLMFGVYTLSL